MQRKLRALIVGEEYPNDSSKVTSKHLSRPSDRHSTSGPRPGEPSQLQKFNAQLRTVKLKISERPGGHLLGDSLRERYIHCVEANLHGPFAEVRFKVQGLGFRVSGVGFWVSGLGFRVSGLGFRVSGLGFRAASVGTCIWMLFSLQWLEVCKYMGGPFLVMPLDRILQ